MSKTNKDFSFLVKYPWMLIAFSILVVIVSSLGLKGLSFRGDYRIYFSDDNPQLNAHENMQSTFSKNDNVIFVLEAKSGNIFTKKNLMFVDELTKNAWLLPNVRRVDSITNFQYSYAADDEIFISNLVEDVDGLTDKDILRIKEISLNEPELINRIVSDKADVSLVVATLQVPDGSTDKAFPIIARKAKLLAFDMAKRYPDIEVRIAGIAEMNRSFKDAATGDIKKLFPIMYLVMAVMLMFCLRSIVGVFSTLVVVFLSVISTLGIAGWLGMYISGPSSSAPTIILTLVIANCVHILSTFQDTGES